MKNIYKLSLTGLALMSAFSAGAQSRTLSADKQAAAKQASEKLFGGTEQRDRGLMPASFLSCDSLTTTYAGGNGNSGIMFNMQGIQNTVITGFHVSLDVTAGTPAVIKIYYRKGTYIGSETTPSDWTFVDSAQVISGGTGVPVLVPINTSIVLPAGVAYGFYITTNSAVSLDYTNGTAEDAVYVANGQYQIREGRGMAYPFISSNVPRIFNGAVHSCPQMEVQCDTINTTYAAGNGQDGAMFDVTAVQGIKLDRLYTSVDGEGWIKVYYKSGSYVGSGTLPSAWTLLDSAYVSPLAAMSPTLINIPLNITVAAGQTAALYVTGNGSGASVDYTDGIAEGAVFRSDSYIQIKEGRGVEYPFSTSYSPRIFNGTIDYCPLGTIGIEEQALSTHSFYPNPFSDAAILQMGNGVLLNEATLYIYDAMGKRVRTLQGLSGSNIVIRKAELAAGLYFYRLDDRKASTIATGNFIIK
jgi:hypothetical protein